MPIVLFIDMFRKMKRGSIMSIQLSQREKDILFSDFPETKEFDRETIEEYSKNTRGSVRLATGRYYTKKEMEERGEKAFSVKIK